jgi:hypothetical protein
MGTIIVYVISEHLHESARVPAVPTRLRASLRLVEDSEGRVAEPWQCERQPESERSSTDVGRRPVLVVGAEAVVRARMLAELRDALPTGTRFLEAQETWEVLARATSSQMVVLVDDLVELSSSSLARLLARRQPDLPVLVVGGTAPAQAAAIP